MTDRFHFERNDGLTDEWYDSWNKDAPREDVRRAVLATIAEFLDKKSTANLIELLPVIDTHPAPKIIMRASGRKCVTCRTTMKRVKEARRRRVRHRKRTRVFDFGACLIFGTTAMMAAEAYLPSMYAWLLGGCVSWSVYLAFRKSREGEFQQ